MPIWFWIIAIIILAATTVASFLLRPKFTSEERGPDPFQGPTIDETRPIMVVWGTAKIDNPACIWWGDLATKGWNDGPVTYAYSFHVGLALGLCFGPLDDLEGIWYGDRLLWSGSYVGKTGANRVTTDVGNLSPFVQETLFNTETVTGETVLILNYQQLYGGIDAKRTGAEGGIFFILSWHNGSSTQAADWYLTNIQYQGGIAYRGYSYIVSRGPSQEPQRWTGYTGLSGRLKEIAFKVRRCPATIAPAYRIVNVSDANPVNCLYELYTDKLWGAGIATTNFDDANWLASAQICYNEALGISWTWETSESIEEIQNQLLATMDGAIYTDLTTGKIRIKLARADYNPNTVPVFDMSSAIEISEFARGNADQTVNEVRVEYVDRDNNYLRSVSTPAQDLAHIRLTGNVNRAKAFYPVSTATNAQKLAMRDLRSSSAALYRGTLKVNRRGATLVPGDVFRLDWAAYNVSNMYMRVVSTSPGTLLDGRPVIRFVQDVFSLGSQVYNGPPPTSWVPPLPLPVAPPVSNIYVPTFGLPHFFTGPEWTPTLEWVFTDLARLFMFCTPANAQQLNYDAWIKPGGPIVTDFYIPSVNNAPYTPYGELVNVQAGGTIPQPAENASIDVQSIWGMEFLLNCNIEDIRYRGRNLFLIYSPADPTAYEIGAFETITYLGNQVYRLGGLKRNLCDSGIPFWNGWPNGHRIYFFGNGFAPIDYYIQWGAQYPFDIKVKSRAPAGVSSEVTKTGAFTYLLTSEHPTPPHDVRINGLWYPYAVVTRPSVPLTISWKNRHMKYQPSGRMYTQDEPSQDITGTNCVFHAYMQWMEYSDAWHERYGQTVGETSFTYTFEQMQADIYPEQFPPHSYSRLRIKLEYWDGIIFRYSQPVCLEPTVRILLT